LAFCFAYSEWKNDPGCKIRLPVQIDGTCNGLQHIAALTGDRALARAVNVLPREDGLPGDVYGEVAASARDTVGRIESLLTPRDERFRALLLRADEWLGAHGNALLERGTAKPVVMTVPYGASRASQARYVLEKIADTIEKTALSASAEAIHKAALDGKKRTRAFVGKCARRLFSELRRRARGKGDSAREKLDLDRVRAFGSFVALAMVVHLRHALAREYESTKRFANWLLAVANRCEGLPLLWQTPLGLPVCQDKFARTRANLSVSLGEHRITLGASRLEENVSGLGQAQALLPNLIHSLDATHLALTINEAAARGIRDLGSIHDCLLCHPNDAPDLAAIVRETFATLYRKEPPTGGAPAVLVGWARWMHLAARIAAVRNASLVLGAMVEPGSWGEQWLEATCKGEDELRRGEARHDLTVLSDIRQLPPAPQSLAKLLLEYAARVPASDKDDARPGRGVPRREKHPLPVEDPALPATAPLDEVATSEYFFS
ncbi:MAG: DNA-directed RNA polymerase, partial [Vitreimonas sp.]